MYFVWSLQVQASRQFEPTVMSYQISANNIYTASGRKAASRSGLYHNTNAFRIAGLIPQSLQPQTPVTVTSVGWCHKSGECATSCARTMSLLLQSRDLGRRAARFVRSALTVATQNDGDFVEVILLYTSFRALLSAHTKISTENVFETGERFPNSREFLYANLGSYVALYRPRMLRRQTSSTAIHHLNICLWYRENLNKTIHVYMTLSHGRSSTSKERTTFCTRHEWELHPWAEALGSVTGGTMIATSSWRLLCQSTRYLQLVSTWLWDV